MVMENGKAKLSINETLHDLDALDTVCDSEYLTAYTMASDLVKALAGLPGVDNLSMADKDRLTAISDAYDEMDDYQKTFVASDAVALLDAYKEKMKEVEALAALAEEDAKTVAGNLTNAINELPSLEELTVDSKDKVDAIAEAYEKMDSYQKSFLEEETVELMKEYQKKMAELLRAAQPEEEV